MKKSFLVQTMFVFLVAVSTVPVQADSDILNSFRESGTATFSTHGVFRDLVLKVALHEFVKEQLPNSPLFRIGNEELNLQDVFIALSDALADVLDGHFMGIEVDYNTAFRHAFVGNAAHKLWIALLRVVGVDRYMSDKVKARYNKYGRAWFSKAFALSVDKAIARIR